MATRKPKVGDPAIIDGMPAVIAIIEGETVEFHDDVRVAVIAQVQAIRALPEEEQKMAMAEFAMNPTPASGTRTWALKKQVFWIEYSERWSCFGRLLSTEHDRWIDSTDKDGNDIKIGSSIRSRAGLHRMADQPYDPTNEIAQHIAAQGV